MTPRVPVNHPGWTDFFEATHIPAAIRDGDIVYVTGNTGDRPDGTFSDDPEEQIRQTFQNVQTSLEAAGATWDDVQQLRTFHVGLHAQAEPFLRVAAEFLSEPYPACTGVGVTELWEEEAIIEIECVARISSPNVVS